jgi:hypothetical protein
MEWRITLRMEMKTNIIIGVLVVLLGVSLFFNYNQTKESKAYKNIIENEFKSKYDTLEQQLRQERKLRDSLNVRIDSLHLHLKSIDSLRAIKERELLNLKTYKNKTSSELENLMIERYNVRQTN